MCFLPQGSRRADRWSERSAEAGEPTGARGSRRLSVVRAVHEPTRNESEGEHVCGPGVILTTSVKGAREGARVKIMPVGRPQTAGRYPPNEVSREAGAMLIRKLGLSGKSVSRLRVANGFVSGRGP